MKFARANTDKIEHGAWVDDIPNSGDLRLKVKGIDNASFRQMQQALLRAFPRQQRVKGVIPPDAMDEINAKCILQKGLLDWDNVDTDDSPGPGKEGRTLIPYSKEQAAIYLGDVEGYRVFFDACMYAMTIVGDADADKEDEGNSASISAGA